MARKTKTAVNMPMMNATNMPMKSGTMMMSLSQMESMMGASTAKKATRKPAGKKGRRSK